MARFTVRGFAKALGMKHTRESVTTSGIFLKILHNRGLAPVVGQIHNTTGRPALVYELDPGVAKSLGVKSSKVAGPVKKRSSKTKPQTKNNEVWEILEVTLRKAL